MSLRTKGKIDLIKNTKQSKLKGSQVEAPWPTRMCRTSQQYINVQN